MKRVLLFIISLSIVLAGCGSATSNDENVESGTTGTVGSVLSYKEFLISLDDAYYANYSHDGIDLNFDRYLAADFTITNNSKDPIVARTLTNFTIVDNNDKLSRVMIDENRKKFNSDLMPGDEFEVTLVFPVMNSSEYTIYYSYGAKTTEEDVLSWTFSLDNTKGQEVESTIDHRDVKDVVKTFLFGDGSHLIEFDPKPATEEKAENEKTSETVSETQDVSEVSVND